MSATGGALAFIEKRLQGLSRDDLIALAQAEEERQKRLEEALYRGSLYKFLEGGWQYIDPSPFVGGWHLEAICEHLEAVAHGQIRRLLINVPPRSSKSSVVSVAWPAWTWAQNQEKKLRLMGPKVQFLFASYAQTLSLRDSVKSRRLVESPWYKRYWGETFHLVGDQNTKQKFETNLGGHRLATSVGGALTGEGGDIIVCFPAEEIVWTERGPLKIGDVVKDRIQTRAWSYNRWTGQCELQPIIGWHRNPPRPLVRIHTTDGGTLTCTADHKIATAGGYVSAGSLIPGASLLSFLHVMSAAAPHVGCPKGQIEVTPCAPRADISDGPVAHAELDRESPRRAVMAARDFSHQFLGKMRRAVAESPVSLAVRDVVGSGSIFQIIKSAVFPGPILVPNLLTFGAASQKCGGDKPVNADRALLSVAAQRDRQVPVDDGGGHNPSKNLSFNAVAHDDGAGLAIDAPVARDMVKRGIVDAPPNFSRVERVEFLADHADATYCVTVAQNHNMLCGDTAPIVCSNCDDPHNAQEIPSDTMRQGVLDWWGESMSTRLNDPSTGAFVIVMQRLHQSDLSGHILEGTTGKSWHHLMIPMRYEADRHCSTALGWNDPRGMNPETGERLEGQDLREAEGRLLCEERFPEDVVKDLEKRLGTFGTSGQLQQRPSPKGGGILKRDHWGLWDEDAQAANGISPGRFPTFSYMLASVDTAYTEKEENDPSAMTLWGVWHTKKGEARLMLVFAWSERLEFNGLVNKVYQTCKRFRVDKVIIEDKAAGHSVEQELRRAFANKMDWSVQLVKPEGDKVARAYSVQGLFEEGIVFAPDKAWSEAVLDECEAFPRGTHDDLVDTVTQAIRFLRKIGLIVRKEETDVASNADNAYRSPSRPLYPC